MCNKRKLKKMYRNVASRILEFFGKIDKAITERFYK